MGPDPVGRDAAETERLGHVNAAHAVGPFQIGEQFASGFVRRGDLFQKRPLGLGVGSDGRIGWVRGVAAFLDFTPVCLKALRPLPYAREPKTLGEHLKKQRYELDLRQKDVAGRPQISQSTYISWETDGVEPEIRYWPRIVAFLGYDPVPGEGETLANALRAKHRELGLPRKQAAALLKIDEGTLKRYEDGLWEPGERNRAIIRRFLMKRP